MLTTFPDLLTIVIVSPMATMMGLVYMDRLGLQAFEKWSVWQEALGCEECEFSMSSAAGGWLCLKDFFDPPDKEKPGREIALLCCSNRTMRC